MTTIQDIADKMGVSKSTVSKALNDAPDISEALRKQVLETAVALGYTKLRRYKKPTKKVCIIIEKENMRYQEPHHFAYDILVGFRQMAEPAGFDVEIVPVDIKTKRSQHYDVFMLKHDYIGAFVVGFSLSDPWIQDFKISRTPAVLFDNYIVGNPSTAYVGIDNEEGMELAVSYLAGLGHRKIAYLGVDNSLVFSADRKTGYMTALISHGLTVQPEYCIEVPAASQNEFQELRKLLLSEERPTAVLVSDDILALSLERICMEADISIPEDLSILSFNNSLFARLTSPQLTSIDINSGQLGMEAATQMISHIENPSLPATKIIVPHQLIERDSCRRI